MSNQTMLEAALSYIAQGFKVFPVRPDKKPLNEHGLKDATQLQIDVKDYWGKWPNAGIGLVTDGFVVVDFDVKNGGLESKSLIEAKYGVLPRTRTHRTGGGGLHYIYRNLNGTNIRNTVTLGGYKGVDLRANGGYILAPPSPHESGHRYEVIEDSEITEAPEWLVTMATQKHTALLSTGSTGEPIPEGQRNTTLASLAGTMRRRGMPQGAIEAALLEVNATQCEPPLPEYEVREIAKSIARYEPRPDTTHFNVTDSGNGERFAAMYGDKVHYVKEWRQFIIHNGKTWEADLSGARMLALAKDVARSIYQEAANELDDDRRGNLVKHAKASESEQRRQAMVKCLMAEPGIEISQNELDKGQFLLNCQNGTIDLRTGVLRTHDKADLITQIVPVAYKPSSKSHLWLDFLQQIFANRQDVISYVQRAIGYSATANQSEQALFFNHGGGWNGKSTFLGAIMDTLGPDYTAEIDPSVLMVRKFANSGPDEAAAMLYKKRFAKSTETEEGQRLSVSLIKRMTGGEDLHCNRKYQHAFNYRPTHKLWLSGNHEPVIMDTTDSIWFRLKKIPFTVTFNPEQRNKNLPEQLEGEREAILVWIVEGCLAWQREGLKEPQEISRATKQYREDQDLLAAFLAERCEFQSSATLTVAELYKAYKQWCDDNDAYCLGKNTFNSRLQEKGLMKDKGVGNKMTWHGIRLLAVNEVKREPEKTKTDSEPV